MNLLGKTTLLTGASKRLGRELARQLDAKGCRPFLVARDMARLLSLRQNLYTAVPAPALPAVMAHTHNDASGKLS